MLVGFAVVVGILVVAAAAVVAPRIRVPLQLLLVVLGVGLAYGLTALRLPALRLDPDAVLYGLLPPLLFAAAWQASLVDLKRALPAVLTLAIGPVLLTTFAVGFALHAAVPAVTLVAALALGAAVAPPDAVSATSIGRSVGMPRRMTELLEDESLLNDPVALTAQGVAVAAIGSAAITPLTVSGDLAIAVVLGVASGAAVGFALSAVSRRVADPVLSTLLSFLTPYLAFLPAQALHGSGVLAVVLAGLIAAQRLPFVTTPRGRITQAVTWRAVSFVLENGVFLLIGLQLPGLLGTVLDDVAHRRYGVGTVLTVCGVVLGVVILARFVFVLLTRAVDVLLLRRGQGVPFRASVLLGWVGMRGVVTLAAAFLLPPRTPLLPVLQLAAFVVVGGTLLLQGLTIGPLVRLLRLRGPDPAEDALELAVLMDHVVAAGEQRLDEQLDGDEPEDVVTALRGRNTSQATGAWERLGGRNAGEPPTALYRRLRIAMLDAQREVVVQHRDLGKVDDGVLRLAMHRIDEEQAAFDSWDELDEDRGEDLTAPRGFGGCSHLTDAPLAVRPGTPGECVDCVREGTHWVHLRTCLTCGHVGCCDSSERKHATRHFHDTQHPVMRSQEPGEAWRWCYVDTLLG